jgi:hypothetical protein
MVCINDIQCVPVLVSFFEVVEVQIKEVSPAELVVFTETGWINDCLRIMNGD